VCVHLWKIDIREAGVLFFFAKKTLLITLITTKENKGEKVYTKTRRRETTQVSIN
jgi:hypothetical protein